VIVENVLVACAVCFVGTDPVMRDSLNAGILALLGVTGVVLAAFAYFFVRLAQRSRSAADLVQPRPAETLTAARPGEVAG
jgi:hypothetical protein